MDQLIIFASLSIIGGIITSYFVSKSEFPTITGLIIVGILVSFLPFTRNLILNYSGLFQIILEIAITLLLFETGLEIVYLKGNKKLLLAAFIQSFFTFLIVLLISVMLFKVDILEGIVIATIWMVTGSDIAITLLKKIKISPNLKVQIGTMVVLDDLIAEIFFFISFPLLKFNFILNNNYMLAIINTFKEVIFSILFGIFLGIIISKFEKFGHNKFPQIITSFAFVLLIIGLSEKFGLHSIMVSLVAGMTLTLISKFEIVKTIRFSLKEIDQLFYTLFIIFSINYVGLPKIEKSLILGLLILVIRFVGKTAGALLVRKMELIQSDSIVNVLIPMLPQSILSAYFAYLAREYLTIFGSSVFTISIASIIIFEVLGYYLIKIMALDKKN